MKFTLGSGDLHRDFEFTINWRPHHRRVAVYFSGGLDSAALLMLVLAELERTGRHDVPVLALTVEKKDGAQDWAAGLFQRIRTKTTQPLQHINGIANDEPAISQGRVGLASLQAVWRDYAADTIIYAGINQQAPDDVRPFEQSLQIQYPRHHAYFQSPFYDLHKPQIVDLLIQLGHEDLIEHTHSCTVQAQGECGSCYSCMERAWGLTALSLD